jgi:proline iminopeptidase
MRFVLLFTLLCLSTVLLAQTEDIVHTPDVDLAYVVYGTNTTAIPIIIANGGPGLSHDYLVQNDVFTSRMARDRRVVLYDQRGDGASRLLNPNAPQNMKAQVADLDLIRAKLGVQKFILIGHSWGGILAMGYAAKHPEHIAKLVLVDSGDANFEKTVDLFDQAYPDIKEETSKIDRSWPQSRRRKARERKLFSQTLLQ